MAPSCYICNRSIVKPKRIFRIPDRHNEFCDRSDLWLKILDAPAESIDDIRVCSDHFLEKQPAKKGDFLNIDWVPNRNLQRFAKNVKYITNYFKEKKQTLPEEFLKKIEIKEIYHGPSKCSNNDRFEASINQPTAVDVPANDKAPPKNLYRKIGVDVVDEELLNMSMSNIELAEEEPPQIVDTSVASGEVGNPNSSLLLPPLKKRKIEIISQKFFLHKEIQTDLTSQDIDALFKYYKNAVDE